MATNQELINSINENISRLYNNSLGDGGNLLFNPDFKINQRGLSEYTGDWSYGVDRWISFSCNVNTLDNGISLTKHDSPTYFSILQRLNDTPIKPGNIALSFSINNTVYTYTGVLTEGGSVTLQFDNLRFEVHEKFVQFYFIGIDNIVLNWVKVEYGSAVTPFVAPDTATELVKCKRYFERLAFNDAWSGNITGYQWGAATPVNMVAYTIPYQTKRIVPTINLSPNTGRFCCCRPTSTVCGLGEINRYPFIAVDHCAVEQYLQTSTPEVTSGWIDAIGNVDIDAEIY